MSDSITLSYRVPDDILRMARSTAGLWFEENSRRLEDGLLVEFPGGWFSDRSRREQVISFTANIPGLTDALQDELRKFGSAHSDIHQVSLSLVLDESARLPLANPFGNAERLRETLIQS